MPQRWGTVQHPLLVVNGDNVPSFNSFELARRLPNAQLSIFPDAGHGGIVAIRNKAPQQGLSKVLEAALPARCVAETTDNRPRHGDVS
jgi:hypothetical protein